MQIYKNKAFHKWAVKEGLKDTAWQLAAQEMEQGLVDADLGGHIVKKRIAIEGRGKRGGVRTLLAYQSGSKAFFIYGFAKNAKSNIKADELRALKAYAVTLLSYSDQGLRKAVKAGALIEVTDNG